MNIKNDKSGASVKFPPPFVYLILMLAAYGVHYFWPMSLGSLSGFTYIGVVVVMLGIGMLILARQLRHPAAQYGQIQPGIGTSLGNRTRR